MHFVLAAIAVLFFAIYLGFYGIKIAHLPFWVVAGIGFVLMLIDTAQELRK